MSENLIVRESEPEDSPAIESLYPAAFPDEDLLPLVRDLLTDPDVAMSLVATLDARIVGHAVFTKCSLAKDRFDAALLGPLAVSPARQRQGIGSALVLDGLRRLKECHTSSVFVLGDPAYYARLGFTPEESIEPPYPLPAEWSGAWQSQALGDTATPVSGRLAVPRQWLQPALWAP